jgi:hypothetical protein
LLTSIFTLADVTKLPRIIQIFKRFQLADCVESFKTLHSKPKNIFLKIFLSTFVAFARVKVDVNKLFQIIPIRWIYVLTRCLFKTNCLVGNPMIEQICILIFHPLSDMGSNSGLQPLFCWVPLSYFFKTWFPLAKNSLIFRYKS